MKVRQTSENLKTVRAMSVALIACGISVFAAKCVIVSLFGGIPSFAVAKVQPFDQAKWMSSRATLSRLKDKKEESAFYDAYGMRDDLIRREASKSRAQIVKDLGEPDRVVTDLETARTLFGISDMALKGNDSVLCYFVGNSLSAPLYFRLYLAFVIRDGLCVYADVTDNLDPSVGYVPEAQR